MDFALKDSRLLRLSSVLKGFSAIACPCSKGAADYNFFSGWLAIHECLINFDDLLEFRWLAWQDGKDINDEWLPL